MSPEQLHENILRITKFTLDNLLRKFQMEYLIETDLAMKQKRLKFWEKSKTDLLKVISVLSVMEQHPVESVHVRTKKGKVFLCKEINPEELEGNELVNMLIEFSKELK